MRQLALVLCLALTVVALPAATPAAAAVASPVAANASPASLSPAAFTFVHLTDTHVGSSQGNKNTPAVFDEIANLPEKPAFIINGGDVTELGSAAQYDLYEQFARRAGLTVYHVPGNHDARWSDAGKAGFARRFGPRYRSFDHNGVHFVLLDSSIDAETHGHLDRAMLDWLAADLAQVGRDRPVLVFAHHPIAYYASRFIDNDEDFLEVIAPYNVAGVFTGHGHLHLEWAHNGVRYFMTAAAMDAGYKVLRIAPVNQPAPDRAPTAFQQWEMRVENRVVGQPPQTTNAVPLGRPNAKPQLRVELPAATAASGAPGAPGAGGAAGTGGAAGAVPVFQADGERVAVRAVTGGFAGGVQKVEVRADLGKWEPLAREGAAAGGTTVDTSTWTGGLDASDWPSGDHEVVIRATDAAGGTWSRRLLGHRRTSADGAAIAWRFRAGGGIQGAPAVAGDLLVFGANDGKVYALDARGGQLRWSVTTGGPVISTPAVAGGMVYAGSADRKLYALDLATGAQRWSFEAAGAVVASPLVADGRVFVGAGDGKMYALDAATGAQLWSFQAGDLIRGRAAHGRGAVYFGSWDGNVYAVDAQTGARRWVADISRQIYYSPANGDLLYHRGRVYVTTPTDTKADGAGIWSIDASDGSIRWKRVETAGFSSPVVYGGDVVYHLINGTVQAVEPLSGESVWSVATGWSSYDSSPVIAGNELVIGALGGRVSAVDPAGKAVRWRVQLGNGFVFGNAAVGPAAGGRVRVWVPSMDGVLYAIDTPYRPGPAPPAFADMAGHWASAPAHRLAADGVVTGYPGGRFAPDQPVARAEMAAMLARYLAAKQPSPTFRSALIDLDGHWAADPVRALEEKGVVQGYEVAGLPAPKPAANPAPPGAQPPAAPPGGQAWAPPPEPTPKRFEPARQVTRAEAAVMIARALRVTAPSTGWRTRFADVASHWAAAEIAALEERGLVRGSAASNGTVYRPDASITRAEVAAMLDRLLE